MSRRSRREIRDAEFGADERSIAGFDQFRRALGEVAGHKTVEKAPVIFPKVEMPPCVVPADVILREVLNLTESEIQALASDVHVEFLATSSVEFSAGSLGQVSANN